MSEIPPQDFSAYPRGNPDPREYYGPPDFRVNGITEAWQIYKSDIATWVLGYVLILVIGMVVHSPVQFYYMWKVSSGAGAAAIAQPDVLLLTFLFGMLGMAVSGALHAGFFRVALQRMRLVHEGIGGIFQANGQGLKSAVWNVLISLPTLIASTIYNAFSPRPQPGQIPNLGQLFGPLFLYLIVIVLITILIFPFFLTPFLIVDQKLSIGQAAAKSWQVVTSKYLRALGFYITITLVGVSGIVACGIGIVATLPLMYLGLGIAYRDHFIPPLGPRIDRTF